MPRRSNVRNSRPLPHARYGVDLARVPDTYIEPFVAYRAWNWTSEGITSLNGALWTPKVAFEATCPHADDLRSCKPRPARKRRRSFGTNKPTMSPTPIARAGCTRE